MTGLSMLEPWKWGEISQEQAIIEKVRVVHVLGRHGEFLASRSLTFSPTRGRRPPRSLCPRQEAEAQDTVEDGESIARAFVVTFFLKGRTMSSLANTDRDYNHLRLSL